MERDSPVKILDKTFRILALFSATTPVWGVTDLAAEAGMPKSTVYRVLRVLLQHEILAQDPLTKRFRLGLGALELGRRAYEGMELRQVALPVLHRIAALSGETVVLEVLNREHDRVVCVERAQRQTGLRLILDIGSTVPLHAGASSKVLLAFLPDDEIEAVIARGLPPLTAHTITDADRLRRDLAEIRARGYAVSYEETDDGAAGVAVPIWDRTGHVVAGLTIAGPLARLNQATVSRYLDLARDGAGQIAMELGIAGRRDAWHARGPVQARGDRHDNGAFDFTTHI
ncbi:MAG: IclR family transcriptional regulator [Dehalococcoidia bacterium]